MTTPFTWVKTDAGFGGMADGVAVTGDPLRGLAVADAASGLKLPQLLAVEIIDAAGLGPKPLAEPGTVPECVCRQDVLFAQYPPTAARPVECHARWRVHGAGMFDLEVSALTPGLWGGLSVRTCSTLPGGLVATLAEGEPPLVLYRPADLAVTYVEMCHPHDGIGLELDGEQARFRLFGHDLEKGVILRGRLRGLIVTRAGDEAAAREAYRAFLREPPNLSL
jgi:hypothetical protein